MKRTITIKGRTGVYDEPFFLLSQNEDLTISFNFQDEIHLRSFRAVVRHGIAGKRIYTIRKGEDITLPAEWLNAGGADFVEISLVLLNSDGTAVVKSDYAIEPLKVSSIDGDFEYTAQLQEILGKIDKQEERFKILEKRVQEYESNGVELTAENE